MCPSSSTDPLVLWEEVDSFPPLDDGFNLDQSKFMIEINDGPANFSLTSIDYSVLDCSICYEPLKPPIHQCGVGHVLCSSCNLKMHYKKCHVCARRTSFRRCFAMENVLNSIKFSCLNKRYGCSKILCYYELKDHGKKCMYALYNCPHSGCSLSQPRPSFLNHMKDVHKAEMINFSYGIPIKVVISKVCMLVLLVEDDCVFLLQKRNKTLSGLIDLSILCTRVSHPTELKFWYELKTDESVGKSKGSCLRLRSTVENSALENGLEGRRVSLVVPVQLCLPNSDLHVFVLIAN